MTDDEMAAAIGLLAGVHRGADLIEALNATPSSVAQAHGIQDSVAAALGEAAGAFKANAPSGGPNVRGLIYASRIFESPARIAANDPSHNGVEGEIAFRFLRDLPAQEEDYSRAEVVQAVSAMAAIEIVSGRYRQPKLRPALEQLADCLMNGALIRGPELTNWRPLDIANLRVKAWVNGEQVLQQIGGHPIGDPVGVAVALVNMLRQQDGIKAGQIVTTGSCTGIRFLQPGDRFEVEFEDLGAVEVLFVA